MALRLARHAHDEVRRQFWMLAAVNLVAGLTIALCIYAFDAMVS